MWQYVSIMYIETVKRSTKRKTYSYTLLRESYRDAETRKTKHRTLLNLSSWPKEKVKALGNTRRAKCALVLLMARIFHQGSRLSAVSWSETQVISEVLGIESISKDELYETLDWLDKEQVSLEKKMVKALYKESAEITLCLYDVTSSYLEGDHNELAAYGYNRNKKKGKKQIVIGLLTSAQGVPLAVRVFHGNTPDTQSMEEQLATLCHRFGVKEVVMVGDKGMIKSPQKAMLGQFNYRYITSITKSQIRQLLNQKTIQMGLFDTQVVEVSNLGKRYILRKNPYREAAMRQARDARIACVQAAAEHATLYLKNHEKAKVNTQINRLNKQISTYKLGHSCTLKITGRNIQIHINIQKKETAGLLDGCYVIETSVDRSKMDAESIHQRYKVKQIPEPNTDTQAVLNLLNLQLPTLA